MTDVHCLHEFPIQLDGCIPVVLSSDDSYAPYAAVTIRSIIHYSDPSRCYAIYMLDGGVSEENRALIAQMVAEEPNFTLQYIGMGSLLESAPSDTFHLPGLSHFSIAAYYRFFIPQLFKDFAKVVYLDVDLILLKDVAALYSVDLSGFSVGACRDFSMAVLASNYQDHKTYLADTLHLDHPEGYFNTGVLLFNIPKMLAEDFTGKCIQRLREIKSPRFVDQCVINSVLGDDCLYLDNRWNFMTNTLLFPKSLTLELDPADYDKLMISYHSPFVIHYASAVKPWRPAGVSAEFAHHWWHFAVLTGFKDRILSHLVAEETEFGLARSRWSHHTYIRFLGLKFLTITRSSGKTKLRLFGCVPILSIKTSIK